MENVAKKFSPAIFGFVIICFFLPFIDITCSGQKIETLTGIQLVTGTTIERPSLFGEREKVEKVEGELLAILAFFSAVVGLGLSFLKSLKSSIAPAIAGVSGSILLLLLKAKLDNDMLREGLRMLRIEYAIGFWLTFLLFLFAAGWNWFLFLRRKKVQETNNRIITNGV